MTDFEALIDTSNAFFAELRANNTKDWFTPRKDHYTQAIKRPAEALAEVLAGELRALTKSPHTAKLFRIHRDVRFSRDKTPYSAHLHLMWRETAGSEAGPVWFFGSAPDYLLIGMGLMGLKGAALDRYRAFVDRDGPALERAIAAAHREIGATISDWGPEPLKRVPRPYDADHPQGDLLRRKALALHAPLGAGWREAGLVQSAVTVAQGLHPVWSLMRDGM